MGRARVVVGTSSWTRDRLPYYAERFEAVEVNSTFYAVPAAATVKRLVTATPDGFRFDVKLHRLLSRHAAPVDSLPRALRSIAKTNDRGRVTVDDRLQDRLLEETLDAIAPLAENGRLAGILLQLTPAFSPRERELSEREPIVAALAAPRWRSSCATAAGWTRSAWSGRSAGRRTTRRCGSASTRRRATRSRSCRRVDATTHPDVAYLRAHGRNHEGYVKGKSVAARFAHRYGDEELEEIAGRAASLAEDVGAEVRVYFNNNRGDDAPVAARRFLELRSAAADPT